MKDSEDTNKMSTREVRRLRYQVLKPLTVKTGKGNIIKLKPGQVVNWPEDKAAVLLSQLKIKILDEPTAKPEPRCKKCKIILDSLDRKQRPFWLKPFPVKVYRCGRCSKSFFFWFQK